MNIIDIVFIIIASGYSTLAMEAFLFLLKYLLLL